MTTEKRYSYQDETKRTFTMPRDLVNLRRIVSEAGSHFFDEKTMRFFGSRVDWRIYVKEDRAYFVTSEQDQPSSFGSGAWGGSRRYTVRVWSANEPASVNEPDGYTFGQFATLKTAQKHAKTLASV